MKFFIIALFVLNLYANEIIGRNDKFDLPELNIYNIKAKLDSGARTSSIHCDEISPLKNNFISFFVLNEDDKKMTQTPIIKKISRIADVKSSNGEVQKRYFIQTKILIYNKLYNIELSLSSRDNMMYPLLIGRQLLKQGFVIDVTKKNLSFKMKQRR